MTRKYKILFVDDEPYVLTGLRRMLRPMRDTCQLSFALSGQEALDMLRAEPFDVIVSDIRMPGIDGTELLNRVRKQYPHIVRIALSGHANEEPLLRTIGVAHQYLSKPCDAGFLQATLSRCCVMQALLASDELRELVGGTEALPSLPSLYGDLMTELNSPDPSIKRIGQIISMDIGMSARILQVVNSPFFGVCRRVTTPTDAVIMLGLDTVKALVLATSAFSTFDRHLPRGLSLATVRDHSVAVASLARKIIQTQTDEARASDESLIAGLLHDIGKLVLGTRQAQLYREVLSLIRMGGLPTPEAEREVFGTTHAQVGAYLLGLWGFSDTVVEAVALHHCPTESVAKEFGLLTAVHVANALEQRSHPSSHIGPPSEVDTSYLADLGLAGQLSAWQRLCPRAA